MEATHASPSEEKLKSDAYTIISGKITEQLDKACVPWEKLWGDTGRPINLITKQPYTGINALLLGMEEYERPYFLTFDEVREAGGKVKRGSKGHTVVRWEKPETEGGKPKMKYHVVFNIAQCENVPERFLPTGVHEIKVEYEQVYLGMSKPPKFDHKDASASYDVVEDTIHLPKKKKKDTEYYLLLFRQLIHSTGHDSRLARKGVAEMSEIADTPLCSKEDLVADIGMCFLLSMIGLDVKFQHTAQYVQSWKTKIEQDKKLVVIAAGQAQKAVDYILNLREVTHEPKKEP